MSTFQHQDTAPSNNLHAPVLESLKQNNQQGRNTAPRIRRQAVLSFEYWAQSHLKTHPLTWPCPSEGQDPASPPEGRHPALLPGSLHKPLDHPAAPVGSGTEARGTKILQPMERRPEMQEVRQNKMTNKYVASEGTRWQPTRTTKWRGTRQSTWKKLNGL